MMANRPFKQRLIGYKIAVLLLYGHLPSIITRAEDNQLTIKTGPLARKLKISTSRLKNQLEYLVELKVIRNLEMGRFTTTLTLIYPLDLKVNDSAQK